MNTALLSRLRSVTMPSRISPGRFKTSHQWAEEWGICRNVAQTLIRVGLLAEPPLMEMKKFTLRDSSGRYTQIPHYAELSATTPAKKRSR